MNIYFLVPVPVSRQYEKLYKYTAPTFIKYLSDHLQKLVAGRLWLKVLLGMSLGIVTGILLDPSIDLVIRSTVATIGNWLSLPGQLFLVLIQMIVVPLISASIIRGLAATEDIEQLRRLECLGYGKSK